MQRPVKTRGGGVGREKILCYRHRLIPLIACVLCSFFYQATYLTEYMIILYTVSGAVLLILQYFFIFYSIYHFIYSIYWSRNVTVPRKGPSSDFLTKPFF